jgi:Phytanoyl-CoA dioxygenase (PhyH)
MLYDRRMSWPRGAVLTDEHARHFAERGFVVVPGLVSSEDCNLVDAEVVRLLGEEMTPENHVGSHFIWRRTSESPPLFTVLHQPLGILDAATDLVRPNDVEVAFDQVQVAFTIPPYDHRPGRPHIDGYAPDQDTPGTFTLLAGLLLTDQISDNVGNLWVWPGTHLAHAAFFERNGPEAFAASGGYPNIELGEPVQIHGRRGDVLLAHYLLGHNTGGNLQSDVTRVALYWRLQIPGHRESWYSSLSNAWHEFPAVGGLIG